MSSEPTYAVGDRVTHLDQDGKPLPMTGTVVAVAPRVYVEWDGAVMGAGSGEAPTTLFSPEFAGREGAWPSSYPLDRLAHTSREIGEPDGR